MLYVLLAVTSVAACGSTGVEDPPIRGGAAQLRVEVVRELPHDPRAFTQGLELAGDRLYESTGLVGRSSVRAGPHGQEPEVTVPVPEPFFAEGLTVTGSSVWQLTWRAGVAFERDPDTLVERRRVRYEGEGWGLCHQEGRDRLVMSDGTSRLTFRDPRTFAETGSVAVTTVGGEPVEQLNELECVGGRVYANVWKTDEIVRIDADTGAVTARIDASGLLTEAEQEQADVLNGIAAIPGTDQFLLTGKLWHKTFRVNLVPAS